MSDTQLKAFILYTQAVEAAYHEWKNYWIDYYMNSKDLYDPSNYTLGEWLKSIKKQSQNATWP